MRIPPFSFLSFVFLGLQLIFSLCLFSVHIRKQNSLVNGSIISADNDSKFIRPYFLIQPQTVLLLPNETGKLNLSNIINQKLISFQAKFKCCFGGDPYPNLTWFHNEHPISSKSQLNKLHDIHYLNIGPVNLDDNGEIKCVIANKIAREEVKVRLLVVRKEKQLCSSQNKFNQYF